MTKSEFELGFRRLASVFPVPAFLDKKGVGEYFDALNHVDAGVFSNAVSACVSSCERFPLPIELLRAIEAK